MSTRLTKQKKLEEKLKNMTEEQRKRYLMRVIPCVKGQIKRNQEYFNVLTEYEKGL